ncbi:hypothetical protein GCM10007874_46150 [Labrys miyagiensis]|uniref:Uncharacterized protein n=1 Tax=Labrys miyagiensis TaxID=346912 RepID=A0ABQ6CMP9_9HYPH|nr:hypothetical protein GCM10007874_46150 [Labrys miyagiensis]
MDACFLFDAPDIAMRSLFSDIEANNRQIKFYRRREIEFRGWRARRESAPRLYGSPIFAFNLVIEAKGASRLV